jgi:hypothetical protein
MTSNDLRHARFWQMYSAFSEPLIGTTVPPGSRMVLESTGEAIKMISNRLSTFVNSIELISR